MARSKSTGGSGEKQRLEILLEEMRSQFKLVLDALGILTQRVERLEQRVAALEHVVALHTRETGSLRQDVRTLTERFEEHLKAHTA